MAVTTNPLPNFAPFLLNHLADVAEMNAPETKVTPTGFLRACLENDPMITMQPGERERLRLNTDTGNIKQVRLSYLQRLTPSQVSTTDTCDNTFVPTYQDFILATPSYRNVSMMIPDATIAQYMEDSAKVMADGTPPTEMMTEFYRTLLTYANGLLGAVDTDLISAVNWGINKVTGLATAETVNIEKDATLFNLSTGWSQVLDDLDQNEFADQPILIGGPGAVFNKFMRSRQFSTFNLAGLDQAGFDDFKYYRDNYVNSQTNWGSGNVGIFSKGSFGFVDLNQFVGFRAGLRGYAYFFQIELPVKDGQSDETAKMIKFDCQLQYIQCPTTFWNGYENVTLNRGWQLIISKTFGLFQIPSTAYAVGDPLYGNNGSLLYNFTNNT